MHQSIKAKLETFIQRLTLETQSRVEDRCEGLARAAKDAGSATYYVFGYDEGGRYIRVWRDHYNGTGKSVYVFVDKDTETIYGSASWKTPNFKRAYGTLDTLAEWDWSDFIPVSKTGKSTLVPKAERVR
jgi:hypothetical protein